MALNIKLVNSKLNVFDRNIYGCADAHANIPAAHLHPWRENPHTERLKCTFDTLVYDKKQTTTKSP